MRWVYPVCAIIVIRARKVEGAFKPVLPIIKPGLVSNFKNSIQIKRTDPNVGYKDLYKYKKQNNFFHAFALRIFFKVWPKENCNRLEQVGILLIEPKFLRASHSVTPALGKALTLLT
jgi:hypothetical protein